MIDMHSRAVSIDVDSSNSSLPIILSYPSNYNSNDIVEHTRSMIRELELLNIKNIIFEGNTLLTNNLRVLGKGCTSIVVKALNKDGNVVALKIMRRDSNRASVEHEANILKIVNRIGIGPKVIAYTKHVLVMEFIEGLIIKEWLNLIKDKCYNEVNVNMVVRDILEQCYRLDTIGVDHGELSNMHKHVIVSSNGACIVDFESASIRRRVSNLTSAVQYLFLSFNDINYLLHIDRSMLIDTLKAYKHDMSRRVFDELLKLLLLK